MLARDQIAARMEASALMVAQADAIGAAVFMFGAESYAMILRELATMIEDGTFNRKRMH